MLYESLAGRPALAASTWAALAQARRVGVRVEPLDVAGLPEPVARLCQRCLDRDPAARPGSAEVARTLRRALRAQVPGPDAGIPGPFATVALPGPGRRRAHRTATPVAVAVAAVLSAAAVTTAAVLGSRTPAPVGAPARASLTPAPAATSGGATPTPPAPSVTAGAALARAAVVQRLLDQLDEGRRSGAVRADVVTDLDNVLRDLQRRFTVGTPVDVAQQVALIRTKISDRSPRARSATLPPANYCPQRTS